ncbi:MAG: hypothetical protein K2L72_05135 [Clostridia bacterium]|nr:hypothetical protein [Clostridia bacterium]
MHEGHRGRLVGKIKDGSMVYEHELLEILLFNSCPRRDLNATAHALIARFGSLGGVLSADEEDLRAVEGVGSSMAKYIVCAGGVFARMNDCSSFAVLESTAQFKEFLSSRPAPDNDRLELCIMDKDGRLKRICAFKGENGKPPVVSESDILRFVSVYRPYGLFVASTKRSGNLTPAAEDDDIASRIYSVTKLCGVKFYDYCIVGAEGRAFSYFVADRLMFGVSGEGYGI